MCKQLLNVGWRKKSSRKGRSQNDLNDAAIELHHQDRFYFYFFLFIQCGTGFFWLSIMSKHVQNFLAALILAIFLPLVPLIMDAWHFKALSITVVTLTAAMYGVSIGISSNNAAIFGLGIILGLIFSMAYGMSLADPKSLTDCADWGIIAIGAMVLCHGVERFNRHVSKREPFFVFGGNE